MKPRKLHETYSFSTNFFWRGGGGLMPLQQYFSFIVAVSFIGGGNRSIRGKSLSCRKSDILYHIMLYPIQSTWAGFELTMLVASSTYCIGSCKSNYYTITAMTAPAYMSIKIYLYLSILNIDHLQRLSLKILLSWTQPRLLLESTNQ